MKSVTDTPMSGIAKMYRGLTVPIRLLPDFLIIGTQRGGTTSLYNYLIARPGVGPAVVKELHFFDKKLPVPKVIRTVSPAEFIGIVLLIF